MSPAKIIQILNIKNLVYLEEMVVTGQVLVTSGITCSVFFLAFANLGFAFASTGALEDALPTVHTVKPCCLPHTHFQVRHIIQSEQSLVNIGELVPREVP